MATVKSTLALVALATLVGACGKLHGLGGEPTPLVSFDVQVTGTPPAGASDLDVALVWGRQWLVEPLCILPPDSRDDPNAVAAVIAAGCRDPFGFIPARVAANAPLNPDGTATIDLFALPSADLMVGDLTARIAYASLVVYDDKNGDGTLNLAVPFRPSDFGGGGMGSGGGSGDNVKTPDEVEAGSFITQIHDPMGVVIDQRIAYREGAYITTGFYPRAGCGDPPPAFSTLAASGFTIADAITATMMGTVPQEADLSQCVQRAPDAGPVTFGYGVPSDLPPPAGARDLAELACTERSTDSTVRYREPPTDMPDFTNRTFACVHYPSFGDPSDVIELVVSGRTDDSCVGLTHYILKGCREGPDCGTPDWDHSLAPPSWWPC
jgi:hypothetical protein